MASVTLEDVRKVYDGPVVAVQRASLTVEDGEFLVLVGPSGCGKSTMLRMIAGLEEMTEGTIRIGDRVVNDVSPRDRNIAMVFQNYALYPHMTVRENMAFGLKLRRFSRDEIEQRVQQAADILGLGELLQRKPKHLSGGQRQRVAVGRAIVRKPEVFLFDEPLSNLDAKLRVQMRAELAKLHHRLGTTMIYVTHDQVEAMTMGDRIVVMRDGVIQQIDTPLVLYGEPRNAFVASFIGSPSMNLVRGVIEGRGDATVFRAGGFTVSLPGGLGVASGRRVIMGIRPEHVKVADPDGADDHIEAVLEVIEPMGNEIVLHLSVGADTMVARVDVQRLPEAGSPLPIRILADRVHLFDAESEERIA
jgi:multiple sugar transport system ATP-binding protein